MEKTPAKVAPWRQPRPLAPAYVSWGTERRLSNWSEGFLAAVLKGSFPTPPAAAQVLWTGTELNWGTRCQPKAPLENEAWNPQYSWNLAPWIVPTIAPGLINTQHFPLTWAAGCVCGGRVGSRAPIGQVISNFHFFFFFKCNMYMVECTDPKCSAQWIYMCVETYITIA